MDSAPPIVLLHDLGDDRKSWDDIARRVAQSFRVLAIDMRGHGQTTRSPRKLYGLDDILGDIHDLVVELSLNGRDWEGNVTRAWTICGRGTGAAIACAYAARYPGRCGSLMLLDYDPQWRKDHLAFSLFQAAHLKSKEYAAGALNAILGLGDDPVRIARALVGRTAPVDPSDEHKGLRFRMDPAFFIHDLTTHNAESLLRSVARTTHVRLVHSGAGCHGAHKSEGGGQAWGAARVSALAASLKEHGALDACGISLSDRLTAWGTEQEAIAKALLALAYEADSQEARNKRAAALKKPPPPQQQPGGGVEIAAAMLQGPPLSDELLALQATGENIYGLGAMGRSDRGGLKARLKELGYKSMRVRVKLEEELIGLPPPAR